MYYVGLDIHTKRISICALDEDGQMVRRCPVSFSTQIEIRLVWISSPT
jgi:hypothetical protein